MAETTFYSVSSRYVWKKRRAVKLTGRTARAVRSGRIALGKSTNRAVKKTSSQHFSNDQFKGRGIVIFVCARFFCKITSHIYHFQLLPRNLASFHYWNKKPKKPIIPIYYLYTISVYARKSGTIKTSCIYHLSITIILNIIHCKFL